MLREFLYFAKIFDLAHSVYEEFILESDLELNVFENENFIVPLISTSADFYNPIVLHENLDVQLKVSEIGTTSFHLSFSSSIRAKY